MTPTDIAAKKIMTLDIVNSGQVFTTAEVAHQIGFTSRLSAFGLNKLLTQCKITKLTDGVYRRPIKHWIHKQRLANPVEVDQCSTG